MKLINELKELREAGVIDPDTANRIYAYYESKKSNGANRLVLAFGILGALLVGLGIILIIAHNWDSLSKTVKTVFAFIPLLIGQILCAYTLLKQSDNKPWREGGAVFLALSIGASISLVSQIYHIMGDMSSFLMTWVLLALPLVYLMRSSMTSLLYLIGITSYAMSKGYGYPNDPAHYYWLLLVFILPYYYQLWHKQPRSNFATFHHWFVPLSVVISLGATADTLGVFYFMGYFALYSLFYLLSQERSLAAQPLLANGYRAIGSVGIIVLLMVFSFWDFWGEIQRKVRSLDELLLTPEFWVSASLIALATALLIRQIKQQGIQSLSPASWIFVPIFPLYILGWFSSVTAVIVNIIILAVGVHTIQKGAKEQHLGTLNYGLIIIAALVTCRFFDTDMSFIMRGVLFVLVGAGFFGANFWMLKQKKNEE